MRMNMKARMAVFQMTFLRLAVYHKPQMMRPMMMAKYTMEPRLNGAPRVFTKNSSVLPAMLMICGTRNMMRNHSSTNETTPASKKPPNEVFFHFLKYTT